MIDKVQVKIKQLENAKDLPLPCYMTKQAAGMDLYANLDEPYVLQAGSYAMIATGIAIALPTGYEAQVRARSGLAAKYGIGLVNGIGTIDADYRGEIKVILINWGKEDFIIQRGERIAQLVLHRVEQIEWETCEVLENTERQEGGFGHTGK